MTQFDMIDKFEAYETEATFTRGNKMTTQVVAMDDIRTVVTEIAEKLANDVNTEKEVLYADSIKPLFSVSLVYQKNTAVILKSLILRSDNKHAALGETLEYFEDEAKGCALILKTVIEINEA